MARESNQKKAIRLAKRSSVIKRLIGDFKRKDYFDEDVLDDINKLADRYIAEALDSLVRLGEASVQNDIAKAKKSADTGPGN